LILGVHSKQDRSRFARNLCDLPGRVDAVQKRHDEINNGYVGLKLPSQSDRLAAVRRLTDDVDTFALEESFQTLPKHKVIVCNEDSNPHIIFRAEY
jgi:hypothetical protein